MGMGFAPTWHRQVSPLLHKTTLTTGCMGHEDAARFLLSFFSFLSRSFLFDFWPLRQTGYSLQPLIYSDYEPAGSSSVSEYDNFMQEYQANALYHLTKSSEIVM